MGRKTIILENEYSVDDEVESFMEDFPQLFGEVEKLLGIQHSSFKTISRYIDEGDIVLFNSTFLYKDQLEEFMERFAKLPFKITFYVGNLEHHIEEWLDTPSFYWSDRTLLFTHLGRCFKRHRIYTFKKDLETELVKDNHSNYTNKRYRYKVGRVSFDHEKKITNVNKWMTINGT